MGSFVILKEECGVEVIETCLYSERGVGGQGGDRGKVEVVAQTRLGCSMEDSGVRESELVGADHRLGAGGRSQLRHDPRDMGLDRRLRHVQTGRDLLVRSPPQSCLRTSRSREVSSSYRCASSGACRALLLIIPSRFSDKTAAPWCTACTASRMASGADPLRRYPEAPFSIPSCTFASSSKTVSSRTRVRGCFFRILAVAAIPSSLGIWISMMATSGSCFWARVTASRPSRPVARTRNP